MKEDFHNEAPLFDANYTSDCTLGNNIASIYVKDPVRPTVWEIPETSPDILDELTELRPENKQWVLQELGFKPGENRGYWTHPVLFDNILKFDIQTDDLCSLVLKIFNRGYQTARTEIRNII